MCFIRLRDEPYSQYNLVCILEKLEKMGLYLVCILENIGLYLVCNRPNTLQTSVITGGVNAIYCSAAFFDIRVLNAGPS